MQDWDDYRYFLAVAECGSVSKAARVLGTTQPTVGRRIADFEKRLGAPLFLRGPSGYRLNDLGAQVCERVRLIETESRWIEERLRHAAEDCAGRVTLTLAESLAEFVVSPWLREFGARQPAIELDLMVNYDAVDLHAGRADVAMRVGTPGSDEYVGGRIGRADFGLYAGIEYLRVHGEPDCVDALADHRIIESVRRIAELPQCVLLRRLAQGATVVLAADSVRLQIKAARAGIGLVALPVYAAHADAALVRVLPDAFHLQRDLWLLTHRDLRKTRRVRAVLDFFGQKATALFAELARATPATGELGG